MKKIAVLMTCHNRRDKTLSCLKKLFSQAELKEVFLSVYLVDDASSDGTEESVRSFYPQIHLIKGDGSLFWNRGMYKAWKTALKDIHDYYLWLNDDTMLYPNALLSLLSRDDGRSIIVGSTCSVKDPKKITYGGRDAQGIFVSGYTTESCAFFNGNIVLIPQFVVDKMGINDPTYPHALGDFDYGLRAGKLGIRARVAPGIQGTCELREKPIPWIDPKVPFFKRLKNLYSPLASAQPQAFFYFNLKHFGLFKAVVRLVKQHIRVMIPSLWLNSSSK